jgi:hypothetical protein
MHQCGETDPNLRTGNLHVLICASRSPQRAAALSDLRWRCRSGCCRRPVGASNELQLHLPTARGCLDDQRPGDRVGVTTEDREPQDVTLIQWQVGGEARVESGPSKVTSRHRDPSARHSTLRYSRWSRRRSIGSKAREQGTPAQRSCTGSTSDRSAPLVVTLISRPRQPRAGPAPRFSIPTRTHRAVPSPWVCPDGTTVRWPRR